MSDIDLLADAPQKEKLDLSKAIPVDATPKEIKDSVFDLIEKLLNHPALSDNKKLKLARLRAFIDINLKDI